MGQKPPFPPSTDPLYVYEMGRPPPPLVFAHWFQGLQKGAPSALILYMGAEKHLFSPHCAQETQRFLPPQYANAAKLITLPNYKIYIL